MVDDADARELLRKDRNEERLLQFAACFFLHVGAVVVNLCSNARRSGRARHEVVDANLRSSRRRSSNAFRR